MPPEIWPPVSRYREPGDESSAAARRGGWSARLLRRARFSHAIGSVEVLTTAAAAVLAATFLRLYAPDLSLPPWTGSAVLMSGLSAASILTIVAMRDPALTEMSVTQALTEYFHVEQMKDQAVRRLVAQVIAHRVRMETLLFRQGNRQVGLITSTLTVIDDWIVGISGLAQLLEPIQLESLDHSSQKMLLAERIRDLETRTAAESDRSIHDQLRETLASRCFQLRTVEEVENLRERGLLRLERAAAAFGAAEAKLAVLAANDGEQASFELFAQDINMEIAGVDAVLIAMQRVYAVPGGTRSEGLGDFLRQPDDVAMETPPEHSRS
jgi:hypothetical protein